MIRVVFVSSLNSRNNKQEDFDLFSLALDGNIFYLKSQILIVFTGILFTLMLLIGITIRVSPDLTHTKKMDSKENHKR